MTDHPAIAHLEAMKGMSDPCGRDALNVAIDSIRALAEFRPAHPNAVVGSRYAVFVVPHQAMIDGRRALGDFDLGRVDVNEMRAQVQADREDHYATLDRGEIRAKWGKS